MTTDRHEALLCRVDSKAANYNLAGLTSVPHLQAHTAPIRSITYTHNDKWILSTDDSGLVRLWTPRLELAQVSCTTSLCWSQLFHTCYNCTVHRDLLLYCMDDTSSQYWVPVPS